MTREEMKKLLESPIAKAWANGETIEMNSAETWFEPTDDISARLFISVPHRFRLKPKPREFWIVRDSSSIISRTCSSKSEAERTLLSLMDQQRCEIVHVREVLE